MSARGAGRPGSQQGPRPRVTRPTGPVRRRSIDPPVLWTWAADDLAGRGVRGVTDVFRTAYQELLATLHTMPERAEGTIRQAWLDLFAYPYPCYRYGPVLTRAYRDEATSAITVQDGDR